MYQEHPKIRFTNCVYDIICDLISGILLSRSRFSTEALMDFIESTPTLKRPIRPGRMVGHSEMTDEQDRVVIEDFRLGRLNLLVATDIAQEGLPSAGVLKWSQQGLTSIG